MMGNLKISRRFVVIGWSVVLAFAVVGGVAVIVLDASLSKNYAAQGEVPIPGTGIVHLPAGQVDISFNAGNDPVPRRSEGLPVPELEVTIVPPAGVAEAVLTENVSDVHGSRNNLHRRLWVAQIAETGDYTVTVDGETGNLYSPRLAFGKTASAGWIVWTFGGLASGGVLVMLVATRIWRRPRNATASDGSSSEPHEANNPEEG